MLKEITPDSFFVVDTSSYDATITEYDPLVSSSVLIYSDGLDDETGMRSRLGDLRKNVDRFFPPSDWFDDKKERQPY